MSCDSNLTQAAKAGGQNGIPTTANKSGFSVGTLIGKGGGVIAGFGAGFGAGTLVSPGLGSMAGGLAGAVIGYKAGGELGPDIVTRNNRKRRTHEM